MNIQLARRLCAFELDNEQSWAGYVAEVFRDFETQEIVKTIHALLSGEIDDTAFGHVCDFFTMCIRHANFIPGRLAADFPAAQNVAEIKNLLITGITQRYDAYKKSIAFHYLREAGFDLKDSELILLRDYVHDSYPILFDSLLSLLIQIGRQDLVLNVPKIRKNRYFIWAVVDYVKDTMDVGFERYLQEVDFLEDEILRRKMSDLEQTIDIYNRMITENRIEHTEDELRQLQDHGHDFFTLWSNIPKEIQTKQALSDQDLQTLCAMTVGQ